MDWKLYLTPDETAALNLHLRDIKNARVDFAAHTAINRKWISRLRKRANKRAERAKEKSGD